MPSQFLVRTYEFDTLAERDNMVEELGFPTYDIANEMYKMKLEKLDEAKPLTTVKLVEVVWSKHYQRLLLKTMAEKTTDA